MMVPRTIVVMNIDAPPRVLHIHMCTCAYVCMYVHVYVYPLFICACMCVHVFMLIRNQIISIHIINLMQENRNVHVIPMAEDLKLR